MGKPKPTPLEMIASKPTIEERVQQLFMHKRSYTGSRNELEFAFRRRYSALKLTFQEYEDIFISVSSESISRAARKVQHEALAGIERRLANLGLSEFDGKNLKAIVILDEEKYTAMRDKLIEECPLLPLPKTVEKRAGLEDANSAYYGGKQTHLRG
jgi:hypothetical protein